MSHKHNTMGWGAVVLNKPYADDASTQQSRLTVGARRSYGDVCELAGGSVNSCCGADNFISWDEKKRIVEVSAGMDIGELCSWSLENGVFPAVVPGTKFATIGGCIANDVHGKNHHKMGSFGCQVTSLKLNREGSVITCSPRENPEIFFATIGGLGLTGEILSASLRLIEAPSPWFVVRNYRFHTLDEYLTLEDYFGLNASYSVAWIDGSYARISPRPGKISHEVRGIYTTAEHYIPLPDPNIQGQGKNTRSRSKDPGERPGKSIAFIWPARLAFSLVNPLSAQMFNLAYWHFPRPAIQYCYYQPYLFPLDNVLHWNRIYGKRGFFQYQCLFPRQQLRSTMASIHEVLGINRCASPLVVLKRLGDKLSGGLLSFPRPGYTLAIDFPNRGEQTLDILARLDEITNANGGIIYPAKDSRMSANSFRKYYPDWEKLEGFREKGRNSDFWLRVNEGQFR